MERKLRLKIEWREMEGGGENEVQASAGRRLHREGRGQRDSFVSSRRNRREGGEGKKQNHSLRRCPGSPKRE